MQIYDELIARGLLAQVTDEDEIRDLVNNGKATFYIGFDCTADSLTAGHFMALTLMKRKPENRAKKIRFEWKRLGTYFVIEWELFINVFRRFLERA